jgi:hypothetical protein
MPQLYVILPVGGSDGSIDNTLPGGRPPHVGGGPPIFHPGHPEHGLPSSPGHPSTGPVYPPGHPSAGLPIPPGHPGNWVPGSGQYPTGGPVIPPLGGPAHPWVPPAGVELPEPPAEIADNVVIAIWNPTTNTWAVASAPAATPK